MTIQPTGSSLNKYTPYNLCCALNMVHGRCTVCMKDFCEQCFFKYHVKNQFMTCGDVKLYWKNWGIVGFEGVEAKELYPYEQKKYGS